MKTKTLTVRWTAVYETKITVPNTATEQEINEKAHMIPTDVLGAECQVDTFEVESVEPR